VVRGEGGQPSDRRDERPRVTASHGNTLGAADQHTPARARVLLLTLLFSPDGVSTAHLLAELVRQLRARGHEILVVTATPHYNIDPDARAAQPLSRSRWPFLYRSVLDDVPVWHVPIRRKGARVLGRALDYLIFHVFSTAVAWALRHRYDIILVPSPPLTTGVAAAILARLTRRRLVYNLQEIYPDVAIELGVLRNTRLIAVSRWLERFVYQHSDVIVVISNRFRRRLLDRGVPGDKVTVIPNFAIDSPSDGPSPRRNSFSRAHSLDNVFVVSYAGNVGLTQDLETVLLAAQELELQLQIRFLIVGDGARRAWLEARLRERAAPNVTLLSYQPAGIVPELYGASDACLIPLKAGTADATFPSKIYTIMASERPAIVMAEPHSDVGQLVTEAECGWRIDPGDVHALATVIEEALRDREATRRKGRAGRRYVLRHNTAAAVARQYEAVFATLGTKSAKVSGDDAVGRD
jgi:colanic acid biosynthesis glycosyl transferase WcaI